MATALTVYLTETASTTVSTADTLLENASTGATLSNKNTNLTSGTTGWVEIWSQGDASAQSGAGSEPNPTGHGWCDDNTTLVGNSFVAGTWTFTLGFECTATGTFTTDVHFRAYQRSSGGTYTLICEAVQTSQTLVSTSYTVLNTSVSASSSNTFASGDKLYIDCLFNITTNSTTGNMRMQASSSSTVGSVSAQVVTPGYSSVTTNTRTISTSAVLQGTVTRTIPTSAVLKSTLTRTIPSSAVLLSTLSRTIPTSAVLFGARSIPTSAVLLGTISRIIPTSAALTFTKTRAILTSADFYNPSTFYASNVGFSILADRPIAYYRLDELSGTIAYDSSGNGYNGSLTGTITYNQTGALASGDICMFFSGLSAGVSLPYTLNPSLWSAATLEFWIKISAGWQYIVVTFDNVAGTQTIYLNGTVYSSGSGDFVGIDIDDYYAGSSSNGYLDEIAIYDHALTAVQISNHYALGSLITSSEPSIPYACELSEVIGGTETNISVTMPASGTNTYVELMSKGGTSSGTLALPSPTGYGWFISLAGQTIVSGPWWSTFTLAKSGSSLSNCSLLVRYYRRTIDGSYYSIGSSVLSGQTFSTTKTAYITPSISATLWQFIAGDVLYIDAFVLNSNVAWSSDVFTVYVSNNATMGVANDGVTYAPSVIATPSGLSCLVGNAQIQSGSGLPIRDQSITIQDALDQRSIARLTEEDASASTIYSPNMPVMISDHDKGLLYTGYLANDQMSKIASGNSSAQIEHMLTTVDHHRDFDKEANQTNYLNWTSGDIICDFIQQQQYKNGIWGEFALESDYTPATLGQGTLSNTVTTTTTSPFTYAPNSATPPITSNTGDLELVRAGTQFTLTEQTTSDFSSGTLTNMTATNNVLKPTTQSAVRFIALFPIAVATQNAFSSYNSTTSSANTEAITNFCNAQIWSGSQLVGTNDTLNFDIWIASSSPEYKATVNLSFSGTTFTYLSQYSIAIPDDTGALTGNTGLFDQNGISFDLLFDLSNFAKDAWYTRSIALPSDTFGKHITSVNLQIQGSTAGLYTTYFKNIYLSSAPGSPFFSTTATNTQVASPVITLAGGYLPFGQTDVIQAYQPALSTRISPAHSISSVGLVQNSIISWTASLPASVTFPTSLNDIIYPPGTIEPTITGSTQGTMNMYVSYDGFTWLPCTNQGALPGLPPGANVSGLSLYLKEQFQAGNDPTSLPELLQVNITINSAANQTTNDIVLAYGNATEWNTGTYNGTTINANGQLINGGTYAPNFSNFGFTYYYIGSHINVSGTSSTLTVTDTADTGTSNFVLDMTDLYPIEDGIIQCTISTKTTGTNQWSRTGIMYRTSAPADGWNAGGSDPTTQYDPPMAGYLVMIQYDTTGAANFLALVYLSPTGAPTMLAKDSIAISSGTNYSIKIVFTNFRHTIYWNGATTPTIDIVDQTYVGAGGINLYALGTIGSSSTVSYTSKWTNFSITPLAVGIWTGPIISLSSLGTCGYTQINWSELATNGAQQATSVVIAYINGRTSASTCANGAEIPTLTPGSTVTSIQLRVIMYSNEGITAPTITGLYARICGNYGTVTGTRISPALSLSPANYVAYSNVMWNSNTPTNTGIIVQTTQDLSTYHTVNNNGAGESLPYWTNQPSSTQDLFTTNTINNYTSTNGPGGSVATINYTESLSNITLTGGSEALYYNNTVFSTKDVDVLCDMDESDTGGLIWGLADTNDYYGIIVYDASSSGGLTNKIQLYKYSGGAKTFLGSNLSITFTRGTFHRIRVKMKFGIINIYFDDVCIQSYLDTSPLNTGYSGLRNSGGTSRYYQLYIQPLGTNLTGQALFTKVTLSTSDPQYMPQLFTLVACVRGSSIASGSVVSQLHPITLPFAVLYSTEMDTLTRISGDYYWYIDKWKQLRFAQRQARQGAFPLQSIQDNAGNYSGYYLYNPLLTATVSADPLRNQQIIIDVTNLVNPPAQLFVSDGTTISWALGYPVYSAPTITINGAPATVGVQGIDNGKQFYWQPSSPNINYDSTLPKLPAGTVISVTYVGQSTVNTVINNSSAQISQAMLEGGNSGIITEIEDANTLNTTAAATFGMTSAQATTYANGLLSRFGFVSPVEIIGTTLYAGQSPAIGLVPGTVISVFLPELNQWNVQLPIVKVTTTAYQSANGVLYLYQIDATNGANLSQWQRVWF